MKTICSKKHVQSEKSIHKYFRLFKKQLSMLRFQSWDRSQMKVLPGIFYLAIFFGSLNCISSFNYKYHMIKSIEISDFPDLFVFHPIKYMHHIFTSEKLQEHRSKRDTHIFGTNVIQNFKIFFESIFPNFWYKARFSKVVHPIKKGL